MIVRHVSGLPGQTGVLALQYVTQVLVADAELAMVICARQTLSKKFLVTATPNLVQVYSQTQMH